MQAQPLRFRPIFKRTIWGGRRLGDQLGKPIGAENDYAESWEVVDHGDDRSVVADGPLAGTTLAELIQRDRTWLLGKHALSGPFPLLLKYLDCNRDLSVQVHPDDSYGQSMDEPDLGKTEAWYVVAADPGSKIYAGLKPGVDRTSLQSAIQSGSTEAVLHSFQPSAGDVVFIPAGTVHALGAGLLVAEIQQSSDTTFRLFDWNRTDADGNSRPLHIQQGLEVTDFDSGPVEPRRSDGSITGLQTIVRCDKFVMQLLERGSASLAGDGKFHIVTVPRGQALLRWSDGQVTLPTGQSVLLPASMEQCELSEVDDATVMITHLPD